MNMVLVTDVWGSQAGSLMGPWVELVRHLQAQGHRVTVIQPGQFRAWVWPGFPALRLAVLPGRRMAELLDAAQPEAIHIVTEGPLGLAARRHCLRRQWPFTTGFHTRLPECLKDAIGLPLAWSYAWLRWFHQPSQRVLVPTAPALQRLRKRGFSRLRAWAYGVDTRLFAMPAQPMAYAPLGPLVRPVSLFVGRVSPGKQIEDFLSLDVPGSKVLCGTGPLLKTLRARYPQVHWLGELPRCELARVYAAADVFVFPSRSDTSGQAMLEAMSCGVPVAAYSAEGPRHTVGDSEAGALHADLHRAWHKARQLPRQAVRERAQRFGWAGAAQRFVAGLVLVPRASGPVRSAPLAAGRPGELARERMPFVTQKSYSNSIIN